MLKWFERIFYGIETFQILEPLVWTLDMRQGLVKLYVCQSKAEMTGSSQILSYVSGM